MSVDAIASRGVAASQVIPNPMSATLRLASDYRRALARVDAAAKPGNASFEGYIVARILLLARGSVALRSAVRRQGDGRRARQPAPLRLGWLLDFVDDNRRGSTYSDLAIIGSSGAVGAIVSQQLAHLA